MDSYTLLTLRGFSNNQIFKAISIRIKAELDYIIIFEYKRTKWITLLPEAAITRVYFHAASRRSLSICSHTSGKYTIRVYLSLLGE